MDCVTLEMIIDYVIPFLVVLTILVFVHEMGHFLVARYNNVRVEVFSIGFGKELFGFNDTHGTRWKFGAIPLGGYVKMFGEGESVDDGEEERQLTDEEKAVSFHHKRLGQRAAIVFAGPLANFVFAVVVLSGLYYVSGAPNPLAAIGTVQASSAAEKAGINAGDRVIMIAGQEVKWFEDLRQIVMANPGVPLSMEILRGDTQMTLVATPNAHVIQENGLEKEIGLLGVTPNPEMIEFEKSDFFGSVVMGSEKTYALTVNILSSVGMMITGAVSREDLGGPLRIAQISGQMAQGGMANLVFFLAALSINLGLINLFPIPMLDGGHLLFYFFEAIIGRPINEKAQEYSFRFGLILVLLLMVFVTWNDIIQLKVFEYLKNLVS
ncbi:MAG: RIP metalloprotease RseP [Rhodospirillaceae bacterium]|nr:RIP metalloprotease RseP [Rhodospirillaceae bacterium]MBL6931109.1 RIP metalloprotease RseP [Rhodospirillales bacterium]MBL6941245.1 RIP metalloprotease RseP [Rhodospirillales bacterium]